MKDLDNNTVPAGAEPWITPELVERVIKIEAAKGNTITADEAVGILHRMGIVLDVLRE